MNVIIGKANQLQELNPRSSISQSTTDTWGRGEKWGTSEKRTYYTVSDFFLSPTAVKLCNFIICSSALLMVHRNARSRKSPSMHMVKIYAFIHMFCANIHATVHGINIKTQYILILRIHKASFLSEK